MKTPHESLLSRLDNALRWTGIPARVADEMSDASVDYKFRPMRWIPMWPIAFSCGVFVFSLAWPYALNLLTLVPSMGGALIVAMTPAIYTRGPLGKPSIEDDEREAALRKASYLFCLGLLACLNCLGQPFLMILSHLQNWPTPRTLGVAISAVMLNATLFGSLPTLYASWHLRQLPQE